MSPKNNTTKNTRPTGAGEEQPISVTDAQAKARATIPDITVSMLLKLVGKEEKDDSLKFEFVHRRARLAAICSAPSHVLETALQHGSVAKMREETARQIQGYEDLLAQQREYLHALFVMNVTNKIVINIDGKDIERTVDSWVSRRDLEIPQLKALYTLGLADCSIPRNAVQTETLPDGTKREVLVSVMRFYDIRKDRNDKLDALVVEKRVIDDALNKWNTNTVVPRELLPRYYQGGK